MKSSKPAFLLLALLVPACQTAPKKPASGPAALPDLLRPYEGALRVLPGRADEKALTLKPGDVLTGACDVAVKVRGVAFDKGTVRFSLESIGQPRVGDRRPRCKELQPGMQLVFTGLDPDAVTTKTTTRIDAALLTPEEYLHRKGGSFDRPQAAAPAEVASQLPDANDGERRLARAVVAWPRPLLSVEALYHDASGKGLHERLVGVEAVVGTDGRVYRPVVKASIDRAHEAALEAALQMWRFDPARRGDGPLGARVPLEVPLRVY
ncbi:MAG: hypothetical protein ACHP85_18185 [Burkholderiales bacterium]|jgi:hypothetical protein